MMARSVTGGIMGSIQDSGMRFARLNNNGVTIAHVNPMAIKDVGKSYGGSSIAPSLEPAK